MKKTLILTLILIFAFEAKSQNIPYFFSPDSKETSESKSSFGINPNDEKGKYDFLQSAIVHRPYNVLKYDLFLDWYDVLIKTGVTPPERVWRGSNKITVRIDSAQIKYLEFDAMNMAIQSIQVDNKTVPATQPSKGILKVNLPFIYNVGDTVGITINYLYIGATDLGFYLYPEKMFVGTLQNGDSVWVESRMAYTMSEPEDARYWMPCNDAPNDKAISTISVRVPKDFIAVSNGLIYKIDDMLDYKVFTWKDNTPVATYLMAVTASKFATFSDWYKRVSNPKDSVEIQYYVWQKDFDATKTDGTQYNAHNAFKPTVDMVTYYSKTFTEFPLIKYGMVAIQPFSFGGMEHQTLTSINRVWMRTADQFGIAHELAHQWIGDMITCATWKDVWINEGGASWSEALWSEKISGSRGYLEREYDKRKKYLNNGGLALPAIYDLPINTIFGNNAVLIYEKASWVYHQLRTMLGDSVYFPALRNLMKKYAYNSLETDDFANHFITEVKNPPISLTAYFDQWLKHPGHPVFDISAVATKNANYYDEKITLTQVQTGPDIPTTFQTVIRMMFWGNKGTMIADTFALKNSMEVVNVTLPFIPDSMAIDSSFSMFQVKKILTTIQENKNGEALQKMGIVPNPVSDNDIASVLVPVKFYGQIELELFDNLGNRLYSIYNSPLDAGSYKFNISTSGLSSGVYRVIMRNGSQIESSQFVIVK